MHVVHIISQNICYFNIFLIFWKWCYKSDRSLFLTATHRTYSLHTTAHNLYLTSRWSEKNKLKEKFFGTNLYSLVPLTSLPLPSLPTNLMNIFRAVFASLRRWNRPLSKSIIVSDIRKLCQYNSMKEEEKIVLISEKYY